MIAVASVTAVTRVLPVITVAHPCAVVFLVCAVLVSCVIVGRLLRAVPGVFGLHGCHHIPPGGILQVVDHTPAGYIGRTATEEEPMHGYVDNKADLTKRLRRAEGQVRGIQRMVDDDVYCIDILTQVSAVTKALETVALQLLEDHLSHCVAEATREGGPVADEKLREASAAIARLVRS